MLIEQHSKSTRYVQKRSNVKILSLALATLTELGIGEAGGLAS
jgi:hypothetical protein